MDRIDVLSFGRGFGNVDFVEKRIGREFGEPGKPGRLLSHLRSSPDWATASGMGVSGIHCASFLISCSLVFRKDFKTGRKTSVALTLTLA